MCEVSVVIRSKNEEELLGRTLDALEAQDFQDFEIVLVDSGSKDRTIEIARRYKRVRIAQIAQNMFTFGRALNVGAELSRGRYVLSLSAHAIPTGTDYLSKLIANFRNAKVAGVYGKQMPLPEHVHRKEVRVLLEDYSRCYGDQKKVQVSDYFFSNASAMIRKSVWQTHPFDENVTGSEDWLWAKQVQANGYLIVYEPEASVWHSHIESLRKVYQRSRREARGFKLVDESRYRAHPREFKTRLLNDVRNGLTQLIRERSSFGINLYSLLYHIMYDLGYYHGLRSGTITTRSNY